MTEVIDDDLQAILQILPDPIWQCLRDDGRVMELLEVIMDLGRVPAARYVNEEVALTTAEISEADIDAVVQSIGAFDADNRGGIERTLHRISAIRNRRGTVVGLTCRVGRAVYGTIDIIQDLINSAAGILLLGRPGIGKTTMLREAARVLSRDRRVVIVDTSNEIGGDGDIPHPAVGLARRMQVENPSRQHEVMIEAVENHNPETIIIDEIGREREAAAARTIAERGVQLIATAHGNTLENILLNPVLADLVGGVEAVTLSDEEARRRGSQKTVLERRSTPTFDVLVEIVERNRLNIHSDVASAVDRQLRGGIVSTEMRSADGQGGVNIESGEVSKRSVRSPSDHMARGIRWESGSDSSETDSSGPYQEVLRPLSVYAYGITVERLERAAKRLRVPLRVVEDLGSAQALVTLKTHYRRRERPVSDAEADGVQIYVLRANTGNQIEKFLLELFRVGTGSGGVDDELSAAIGETDAAIEMVLGSGGVLELTPRAANIRREQHQRVRRANLTSQSCGRGRKRRVRVFRQ